MLACNQFVHVLTILVRSEETRALESINYGIADIQQRVAVRLAFRKIIDLGDIKNTNELDNSARDLCLDAVNSTFNVVSIRIHANFVLPR